MSHYASHAPPDLARPAPPSPSPPQPAWYHPPRGVPPRDVTRRAAPPCPALRSVPFRLVLRRPAPICVGLRRTPRSAPPRQVSRLPAPPHPASPCPAVRRPVPSCVARPVPPCARRRARAVLEVMAATPSRVTTLCGAPLRPWRREAAVAHRDGRRAQRRIALEGNETITGSGVPRCLITNNCCSSATRHRRTFSPLAGARRASLAASFAVASRCSPRAATHCAAVHAPYQVL